MKNVEFIEEARSHTRIGIFVVEDHEIVRTFLCQWVNSQADMYLVGEAADGATAIAGISEKQPDIILLDISLPDVSGIDITIRLLKQWPHLRILALTSHEDRAYRSRMIEVGALGYLVKRSAGEALVHAIHTVHAGQLYLDPLLATD